MFKEVALAGGVELAGGYTHTQLHAHSYRQPRLGNLVQRGRFFADAETNPCQREPRRRNRKGWSVNSVIVACVRRDDDGRRADAAGKAIAGGRFEAGG